MELTVDDIWHIADAGDQELRRLANSKEVVIVTIVTASFSCTHGDRFATQYLVRVQIHGSAAMSRPYIQDLYGHRYSDLDF